MSSLAMRLMPEVLVFAQLLGVEQGALYPIVSVKTGKVKGWYVRDRGFYRVAHPASWNGRRDNAGALYAYPIVH